MNQPAQHLPNGAEPPQQITIPPVRVGVQIRPGPDGQPWIQIDQHYGFAAFVMVVTPTVAGELIGIYRQQLTEGIADARRAASGLILPGHGPLPPIPPGR